MEMLLETWVVVIIVTMVLGGSVLWWVTGPRKRRFIHGRDSNGPYKHRPRTKDE